MFFGEFEHKIDKKGRVSFPSKFRHKIKSTIVITRGDEGNLLAFPYEEWEKFGEKLAMLPNTDRLAQAYIRQIYSFAAECQIDSQGRINLTNKHIEYCGIDEKVTFIGKPGKIEIWSPEALEQHRESMLELSEEITKHMAGLNI